MKMCLLRQSSAFLLIGLVMFAFVNVSWVVAGGVEVEVPYAATSAQWWTGIAIKNRDASSATDTIKIKFFDTEGVIIGTVDIGSLEPEATYINAASIIYGSLPESYSIRISQPGNEELAVTVFVGNSATGGFAYQTYNSQACCQATASLPSWDQILPDEERFEQVMPRGRNSQAVLDRETGLVWQRDTSDSQYDWYGAQTYCYGLEIGGRKGWRLPTIDELATLVDSSQISPALPDGHPFTNVKFADYWSSTTSASNTNFAWRVYFSHGNVYYDSKSNSYYVRAVRSGQ